MKGYKLTAQLRTGHGFFDVFPEGKIQAIMVLPKFSDPSDEPLFVLDPTVLSPLEVKKLADLIMRRCPLLFSDTDSAEFFVLQGVPLVFPDCDEWGCDDPYIPFCPGASGNSDIFVTADLVEDEELDL